MLHSKIWQRFIKDLESFSAYYFQIYLTNLFFTVSSLIKMSTFRKMSILKLVTLLPRNTAHNQKGDMPQQGSPVKGDHVRKHCFLFLETKSGGNFCSQRDMADWEDIWLRSQCGLRATAERPSLTKDWVPWGGCPGSPSG